MRLFAIYQLCLCLLLALETPLHAQTIPLPRLDGIDIFGSVGDFESHTIAPLHHYGPFDAVGWGFETLFTVTAKDDYLVEIGVSYAQLFERATLGRYTLTGEVRDLPGSTVYVTFPHGLYVGLGTGVTALAHASINDGTSRYSVGGDTLDLSGVVGYVITLHGRRASDRRVNSFVEIGYHARYFGGLDWGSGAPATLPISAYLGGCVVSFGVQIAIGAKAAIAATPGETTGASVK
jgi:hypothetical protein